MAILRSFHRKNELEAARYWLDDERDKLKERIKPPQLYNSKGEAIPIQPVAMDQFYAEAEETFLENLGREKNDEFME